MRKHHRIRQENFGNRWDLEAVFQAGRASDFSDDFQPFPTVNQLKKNGDFSARNNAFKFHRFPKVSCRNRPVRFNVG
jgi:hypothetical protein